METLLACLHSYASITQTFTTSHIYDSYEYEYKSSREEQRSCERLRMQIRRLKLTARHFQHPKEVG